MSMAKGYSTARAESIRAVMERAPTSDGVGTGCGDYEITIRIRRGNCEGRSGVLLKTKFALRVGRRVPSAPFFNAFRRSRDPSSLRSCAEAR